ncbi:MAG TPA: hypothetical protein VH186_09065, partial [Chloroflexia bacterium]|nr:hypothetical protein [Chloroflexia bacterium]
SVYRQLLAAQPDGSVVIVSIGYMGRLSELLDSPADGYSSLTGKDLITQKVKTLVVMGGDYPSGTGENNFVTDPAAAANVVSHWPTKIVFSGYTLGFDTMTGSTLSSTTPASNPVRRSYEVVEGAGNSHRSYDLTAVYHAIRPDDPVMTEVGPGTNTVDSLTGANTFVSGAGNQYYLEAASNSALASALEPLLAGSSQCAPLVVTNSTDDAQAGTCGTFSYALKEATLSNQAVSVTFNPGLSGVTLAGPLGPISHPRQMAMTIDGSCQNQNIPGASLQAGPNAAAIGLRLTNLITVKCLSIVGFSDVAISVEGNNNQVISSWLGTLDGHSGTSPGGGIRINGSNNSLGLAGQAASGNLIFGNNNYAVQVVSGQGNKSYYNTISLHNLGNIALPPAIRALSVVAGGQLKFGPGNHITSP